MALRLSNRRLRSSSSVALGRLRGSQRLRRVGPLGPATPRASATALSLASLGPRLAWGGLALLGLWALPALGALLQPGPDSGPELPAAELAQLRERLELQGAE